MNIFFDAEFTGLHQATTLISIGLAAENGREFYAEFTDYDREQIKDDEWMTDNVLANLMLESIQPIDNASKFSTDPETRKNFCMKQTVVVRGTRPVVARLLGEWLDFFGATCFLWGDCVAYDFVLFCELFGGALSIPPSVYYTPFDLSTYLLLYGIDPDVNREEFAGITHSEMIGKHNALFDALVIKSCWEQAPKVGPVQDCPSLLAPVKTLNRANYCDTSREVVMPWGKPDKIPKTWRENFLIDVREITNEEIEAVLIEPSEMIPPAVHNRVLSIAEAIPYFEQLPAMSGTKFDFEYLWHDFPMVCIYTKSSVIITVCSDGGGNYSRYAELQLMANQPA